MKNFKTKLLIGSLLFLISFASAQTNTTKVWRNLLKQNSDCVTWVSFTMRIEVSANGRSMPPQEQKVEALGTVIANDGLTVLSLSTVDPRSKIFARLRSNSASVQVNYTEVFILKPDGTEIPAKMLLKDADLDLAFVLPINSSDNSKNFPIFCEHSSAPIQLNVLDEVVSIGKLGKNLYRQSTLRKGWVNALIEKPRKYFVIENISPGTPVFDKKGSWVGVAVYKMERGIPSALITLPSNDILEIANQVRTRTQ